MNDDTLTRLELSRRYAWLGPACGLAAMIALFVFGLLNDLPALLVLSSTMAVLLIAIGVSVQVSLTRRLAQAKAAR